MISEVELKLLSKDFQEREYQYRSIIKKAREDDEYRKLLRFLGRNDRYFLLTKLLRRKDARKQWVLDRCLEVEADPDGYLDVWAREHFKSSIITFAGAIQEILKDPEITIAIFSFTRPIAKGFLRQIKIEFETNQLLKWLYPDILWENPIRESRKYGFKWSEDAGLVVKRKGNPKESTLEAWGLVDGQPTSKHFKLRIYDDIIEERSANSENMRAKATRGWELSQNLAARGKDGVGRQWHVGTFYHHADTYFTILKKGVIKIRKYPATEDGTPEGKPVLLSGEELEEKRKLMGAYVFATQMLLDPKQERYAGFKEQWLKFWNPTRAYNQFYMMLLVDPAKRKTLEADYTTMWVLGLGADRNIYVFDLVRDKMNLTEKTNMLFLLHSKYHPRFVGYEQVSMQSDIEHIETVMEMRNYRFYITPLKQTLPKKQRIDSLVPLFELGRIYLPRECWHENWEGKRVNTIQQFIDEEYIDYPYAEHDDMLDGLANINHKDVVLVYPNNVFNTLRKEDDDFVDEKDYDVYEVNYGRAYFNQ